MISNNLPLTVMLNVQEALLPELSAALYVTTVSLIGKYCPGLCELQMNTSSFELSENSGSSQTTLAPCPSDESVTAGDSQRSTVGGSSS